MLQHSDIRTIMNLYTQDDRDEKQAAQGHSEAGLKPEGTDGSFWSPTIHLLPRPLLSADALLAYMAFEEGPALHVVKRA